MGCPNDSVVGWGCAESAGCSAAAAAEYAETVDSADNFHLVLQNEMENSEKSYSGASVATRLPLRLKLSLLFSQLIALAFQTDSLIK